MSDIALDGIIWINDREDGGDVVLFGQADPAPINIDEVVARFDRADNGRAAQALRDLGFPSAINLMSSYGGHAADLAAWLKDAAINTDRDLRLQYLAGMGLNAEEQDQIHFELMEARRISPGLFVGSAERLAELHKAIDDNKRRPRDPDGK